VRNLYLHGGLLLTSPYDKFVYDSGGIPTRVQQQQVHNSSVNTEQIPLLRDAHPPGQDAPVDNVTVPQEGPRIGQTEMVDPVGGGGYATFSGHSNRKKVNHPMKRDTMATF